MCRLPQTLSISWGVALNTLPPATKRQEYVCDLSPAHWRDAVPEVFSGGYSRRHLLFGIYQNSKRKGSVWQKLTYKQSRHSESLLSIRKKWKPYRNSSSWLPLSQAGLSKNIRLRWAMLTLSALKHTSPCAISCFAMHWHKYALVTVF